MMNIVIDGIDVSLELLESQRYRNMEVIPVRLNNNGHNDYLTLRRGMSAGFVELTECEVSTVGAVLARNNSNIPLVLIDGDEIVGAKQNRIMNRSLIIPPKTTMTVSVSCTEQGRWHYGRSRTGRYGRDYINFDERELKENFEASDFAADFSTRKAKSENLFQNLDCQSSVWNSISELENKTAFRSRTGALNDNYVHHRAIHNDHLRHFKLEFGQCGAIFIINGQIKGLELFYDPVVYQEYHEKIYRSYIMEAISNRSSYRSGISYNQLKSFLKEISNAEFRYSENKGIGRHMNFSNIYGTGSVLMDGRNLVHLNYFNSRNPYVDYTKHKRYGSFRDFADDY